MFWGATKCRINGPNASKNYQKPQYQRPCGSGNKYKQLDHMVDYIKQLDTILSSTGEKILVGAGTVSHNKALEKAKFEYKKYQVKTISPVEK